MRKQWLVVLVLMFSVTILFPSRSMAEEDVRIAYLNVIPSLPTFVAIEKGYFSGQGLKVVGTPFESGTLIVDALVAGRVDVVAMSSIIGYWLVEQNNPGTFKIFLIYGATQPQDNTFILMVAKDSPWKGIIDLKGKRVGVFPGISSLALARATFRPFFDPDKEVTLTETPPGSIIQALAVGQIDAYLAPEPFGMMAIAKGAGRHLVKSPLLALNLKAGIVGGAFVFNSNFLREKPQVTKKVKGALYHGVDFIKSHEAEARKFLVKHTGLPEPFAMKIPFEEWIKLEQFDKSSAQPYFDVLKNEGLFQKYVDTSKLYYMDEDIK
jgi:ABC-type nitrate/sulfonate/bicarbonate transport system substrate-binding protein